MFNTKSVPSEKNIYFWNTLGGLLNAAFSVIIMMILTRSLGMYAAGIFSLGYSNAMLLQHVGSFDSRSYQCSCFKKELGFSCFFSFRLFTSVLMLGATVILIFFFRYPIDKALSTLLLSLFCIMANTSDIFQGNAQKSGRLDLAGKSLSFRIVFCIITFSIALMLTHNYFIAVGSIVVFSIFWILFYDVHTLCDKDSLHFEWDTNKFRILFINTFPLFLSLFSQVFIFNMPKYAIDAYMTTQDQGVYGIIFMPASIVSLFATFLFRPIMVNLSLEWEKKSYTKVIKISIERIFLVILGTVVIVIAGAFLGTQVLSLVYGTNVTSYKKELIILLIGGGFSGISVLLYYLMTIVRKQYWMVLGHIIVLFFSWIISFKAVKIYGMIGAAYSYLFSVILLDIVLVIMLSIIFYINKKGN